jgi:2-succinyl-5-enolpyruvyl-6-hydroxy-3-cyclohexene-1-carboxylate synthase
MPAHDAVYVSVAAFVDQLSRSGVEHACVCPGSRSTPLAMAMATHSGLRAWSHIDERSGAFFALGIAKATHKPVAVVCTSGTAAANFFPAVIEASYSHVPLLVLTADRPAELRDCGAGQTIDQIKLYGSNVKWFAEAGTPETGERYFRSLARRAVATASAVPPGPVHINFPFREPLMPSAERGTSAQEGVDSRENNVSPLWKRGARGDFDADDSEESPSIPLFQRGRPSFAQPSLRFSTAPQQGEFVHGGVHEPERRPTPATLALLEEMVRAARRGLVVCGPYDGDERFAQAVSRFAAHVGYPIFADPLSQMRSGTHDTRMVVGRYDALLRHADFATRMRPDLILRCGAMPTSKAFLQYVERHSDCRQIVIDPLGFWRDPTLLAADVARVDPTLLFEALADRIHSVDHDAKWRGAWVAAEQCAVTVINAHLSEGNELFEGKVFADLADLIPDRAVLYVGNSMPVRDLDGFWSVGSRRVRFLCNRGANGIDGFVSSGLGAAAVSDTPVVMVTGDLGFYHDLNGLMAVKRHGVRAMIIVLNNNGGGIFGFLPQADCGPPFEEFFVTPHGLDFRGAVEMYGATFIRICSWAEFHDAVRAALRADRTTVIEVPVDRARNIALHREIWAEIESALSNAPTFPRPASQRGEGGGEGTH